MDTERGDELARRVAMHAALADPARLLITDTLSEGDASPSELGVLLGMPSNLLAHHLRVLEDAGIITRRRSEGDHRRSYLRLVPGALGSLGSLGGAPARTARRLLFVCTANSARSHLAAALWRQASAVPATSAGTRPAAAIDPGAVDAAQRHQLPFPRLRPRHISGAQEDGDLVITVCDLAHEELGPLAALHWSVRDPVPSGDPVDFDEALAELSRRVGLLAPRVDSARALPPLPDPGRGRRRSCSRPWTSPASATQAGLTARMMAEWMPGAASFVNATVAFVNPAAARPSRYSVRDSAPAMHPA